MTWSALRRCLRAPERGFFVPLIPCQKDPREDRVCSNNEDERSKYQDTITGSMPVTVTRCQK